MTWEEDWRSCRETPSVWGNSRRGKSESHKRACMGSKKKELSYLLISTFSFDISQAVMKLLREGVWWREGSICTLPLMSSQLKADRQTRPDQTQRGSALPPLTITRRKAEIQPHIPTVDGALTKKLPSAHATPSIVHRSANRKRITATDRLFRVSRFHRLLTKRSCEWRLL